MAAINRLYRRTRLAPTPSGFLHIGNVVAFVLTAGLARSCGASIMLRIDDLDRQRMRMEYVDDIFDTLAFLGIPWDEGPNSSEDFIQNWSQHSRMDAYQQALEHLKGQGEVFACSCSRAELSQMAYDRGYPGTCMHKNLSLDADGHSWRLLKVPHAPLHIQQLDGSILNMDLPEDMQRFVVRRRDGLPSYQLASVSDDIFFEIDLVVRGMDLRPSTLAQLQLASLMPENSFAETAFVHHPLLMDASGGKLSKSAGATSIRHLRMQGYDRAGAFHHISACLGIEEPASDWGGLFESLSAAGWVGGRLFH